ncbi:DUF342 domain-containing protein [Caldalkalibacillus mannanilyticus]|uniref:DUF342 domain-containing protein n=1 Tax=Caldalkalibacillus mannanilyticus TaxID=1418 RepID=UPI0004699AF7|nr:FapA family protein [Caldalkalibacillus mannanilyticus]
MSRQDEFELKKFIDDLFTADEPLNKTEEIHQQSLVDEQIAGEDGYIILKDHQLVVKNSIQRGRQPVLLPHQDLSITVNGETINEPTVVYEKDQISWELNKTNPFFDVKISEDRMKVYLKLNKLYNHRFVVKDKGPSTKFQFQVDLEPYPYNYQQSSSKILSILQRKHIKVDIDTSAIMRELMSPTYKEILVAEGLPQIESKDGYIETFFSVHAEEVLEEINGKIDYRNRFRIPSIQAGEVIAIIHPPKQGKEGYDVFGQAILPQIPKKIEVRARKNVEITEEGQVIALKGGRPSITGTSVKHIDISQSHIITGDVDIRYGNVYFNGDVVIRGDVKEGMRVEAIGNVFIYGNVFSSTVISSQSIYIEGNVNSSQIYAGQHGLFFSQIYKSIQNLEIDFTKLKLAITQIKELLVQSNKTFTFGHIAANVIEMKMPEIMDEMKQFSVLLKANEENDMLIPLRLKLLQKLLHSFRDVSSIRSLQNEESLNSIIFTLNEVIKDSEEAIQSESEVLVHFTNMSTIKTNGNIIIAKEGALNSHLFAGKDCLFVSHNSVIKGGKIEAIERIQAAKVGSEKAVPPQLAARTSISVKELYAAKIKMHNRSQLVDKYMRQVTFVYDEEEGIVQKGE